MSIEVKNSVQETIKNLEAQDQTPEIVESIRALKEAFNKEVTESVSEFKAEDGEIQTIEQSINLKNPELVKEIEGEMKVKETLQDFNVEAEELQNNTLKKEGDGENLENHIFELKEKFDEIKEDKLNPEQKSAFLEIKNKIFNISKKVFKTITWVAVMGGIAEFTHHKMTHSDLEIHTSPDGSKIYKHEDKQTTHLINCIAGYEEFTEEEITADFFRETEYNLKQNGWDGSININEISIDQFDEIYFEFYSKNNPGIKRGELKNDLLDQINMATSTINSRIEYNKKIYDLIWQLEQECGNPRIKFVSEAYGSTPIENYNEVSHYSAFTNTVYLHLWSMQPSTKPMLISELSHAKQAYNNPIKDHLQYIYDISGVLKRGGFNMDSLSSEYAKLYETPGSIEFEAHEQIEPELNEKYPLFKIRDEK